MRTYVSCNCGQCKPASPAVKREHKKKGHRALRRATKAALREDREPPRVAATGYKD